MRVLFLILIISIAFCSCKAQSTQIQIQENLENLNNNIRGTWISVDDPNWRIEFNANGNCYWYYTNEGTDVFTYSILTTSPQCEQEVKTGGLEDFYLSLVDQEDNDEYCYEIFNISNETLSINYLGLANIKVFNKQ